MKRFICSVILLGAAALCSCVAQASTSSPEAASPSPAKTSAFAGTSWSPKVKTILAESKAAMGGATWNHIASLRAEGTTKAGGLVGSRSSLESLQTGRWISYTKLGPIEVAYGFDGQTLWYKPPNGQASPIDAPDAKKRAVTSAYTTERAWWYPERSPAKIKLLGGKQADGKTFYVLKITPKGGKSFKLWINAKTHLFARNESHSQSGNSTTYLSDYRTVEGIKIPFHRLTVTGKQRRRITRQLKSVSVNVPVSASDFAMPVQNRKAVTIIGGGNQVTIPFKYVGNLISIRVKVNGHPFNFIVDSGGGNVLTPQAARAIGIEGQGALKAGGYGSKTVKAGFSKVKSLVLDGKISFRNQLFRIIPLPGMVSRQSIAGTVGYGLFKHFVVRIDYAHKKLTLSRPANFGASNAGTRIPISFFGPIPAVKGSIDGLPGLFLIDTGTNPTLILASPFARKHDLCARYRWRLPGQDERPCRAGRQVEARRRYGPQSRHSPQHGDQQGRGFEQGVRRDRRR
ncbi:MAG: aspartyl protease family protein [Gammaproteobacteria bacterium]|nr:aspartyl protease family protein [Gammaproteobacteria bacterium]